MQQPTQQPIVPAAVYNDQRRYARYLLIIGTIPQEAPERAKQYWRRYALTAVAQIGRKQIDTVVWPWEQWQRLRNPAVRPMRGRR